MFRFLRRVFILLVLFVIIFLVFRFVKPEATNRFVDKVKWIPTTISSRFHREKKSEIVINWSTTSTSSNFEVNGDDEYYEWSYNPEIDENENENKNKNDNETDNKNDRDINDSSRLEELNRELDKIIASGDNKSQWYNTGSDINWNLEEIISWLLDNSEISTTDITWTTLTTWSDVVDVEQPYEQETQDITQSSNTTDTQNTSTTQTNNNQSNDNTSSQQKRWDCGEWLTVQDCEQMKRDFWNYN